MIRLGKIRRDLALWRDERGSVAIHAAIMSTALIGMSAVGIEGGYLLLKQRQMQAVADAAAYSAAVARATGKPSDYRTEGEAVAARLGYRNGTDGSAVTVRSPPLSGPNAGNSAAVEVIISQPQALALVTLVHSGGFNVGARAVATVGGGPSYCVLQLKSNASRGFYMSNGAAATLEDCGVAVDSSRSNAFTMSGGARLSADRVSVVGGSSISNGAHVEPSDALNTYQAVVSDPYDNVAVPSYSGCGRGTGKTYNAGTWTMSPGVYCKGVSIQNAANVTMTAGIYIIDRGTFYVGGGAKLRGENVTIILTNSSDDPPATVDIGNGASVYLTAPTSGATAGLVFFGDRLEPEDHDSNYFRGGASITVLGAIYFPLGDVEFENGASNTSACTQLIAATIELRGGSKFRVDCPTGVRPIVGGSGAGGASQLVE